MGQLVDNLVKLTRQELYDKIWATPISKVAKEYGLSDVGLAKICKRHQIPRPPVGYWAQIQYGGTPRKLPLPPPSDISLETIQTTIPDKPDLTGDPHFKAKSDRDRAVAEGPGFEILVSETLTNPHPLVRDAASAFRDATTAESGIILPKTRRALGIQVTPRLLDRALRIWNALIPAFQSLGYVTTVGKDDPNNTIVTVLEEPIPLHIAEEIKCTVRDATPEEQAKMRRQHRYESKITEYHPTGKLYIKAEASSGMGLRQRWSDSARTAVDYRLAGVVQDLIDLAVHLRA